MRAAHSVGLDQLTDISKLEQAQSREGTKNQEGAFRE